MKRARTTTPPPPDRAASHSEAIQWGAFLIINVRDITPYKGYLAEVLLTAPGRDQ
jgi:hypothetical protein